MALSALLPTLFLACAANPPPGQSAGAPYLVRGTVTDSNTAQALGGSGIEVGRRSRWTLNCPSSFLHAFADSAGRFVVSLPGAGRYCVWAMFIGHRPDTVRLQMPRDSGRAVRLRLPRTTIRFEHGERQH